MHKLFGEHFMKLSNRADSFIENEEFEKALAVFLEMEREWPNATYPPLKQGRCLVKLKRYKEAATCFHRCIEIEPNHPTAPIFLDEIAGK